MSNWAVRQAAPATAGPARSVESPVRSQLAPAVTSGEHEVFAAGRHAPGSQTTHVVQQKLPIRRPGDTHEREAGRVSEQAMQSSEPQRLDLAAPEGGGVGVAPPIVHDVLRGSGQPVDPATRAFMEPRLGHDFSGVRVHSGPVAAESARQVDADAYTVGHAVVLGAGAFSSGPDVARQLLAHELTHVVQQTTGELSLQRGKTTDVLPGPKMTQAEADAWYREMNVDDAFADPSPWADGGQELSDEALEADIEQSLQKSLTPEEMHRQLLVRRAQGLGASAYQAADPQAALAGMQRKIKNLRAQITRREAKIARLKKLGPASKAEMNAAKVEVSGLEDEVKALTKAKDRLPKATKFSRIGKGAPAGTGEITYAGIQIETAEGQRIALEFAETTTTEHAEEVMIGSIESKLTKAQLRGARVTVVGDQVVCGERCVPALTRFAERNGVASVDGIVFQREVINPKNFIGPPALASPRTTLRTMTEVKSAGRPLIKNELAIYRSAPAPPTGAAASGVEHAVGDTAEKQLVTTIERTATEEPPGFWLNMARNFGKGLRSITPAKVAKFGKNLVTEGVKGFITGKLVDFTIGDSRLEDDLAALDAANHRPHNALPEKIRSFEKEAIGFLPTPVAVGLAGAIRTINPLSADFLYEATLQENSRKWEKFKEEYGDSDEAAALYNQSEQHADDVYNGLADF